jgi:hypothetical protein
VIAAAALTILVAAAAASALTVFTGQALPRITARSNRSKINVRQNIRKMY